MRTKILVLLTLLQVIAYSQNDAADPVPQIADLEAYPLRLTVRVVDEAGNPIEGAQVKLGFFNLKEKGEYRFFNGNSKLDGEFSAEFPAHASDCPIEVTKIGYYESRTAYDGVYNDHLPAREKGRFEPWNPTVDVILKKIGDPIPMYVRIGALKNSRISIPGYDVQYNFDLLEWDWLHPNGQGKVADWGILLESGKGDDGSENPVLKLSLLNEHDGMSRIEIFNGTESLLRMPRLAPESPYNVRHLEFNIINENKRFLENGKPTPMPLGYFLRIRTVLDEKKNVKSCHYGMVVVRDPRLRNPLMKVYKTAGSEADSIPLLEINGIFINPSTMDRNLEWNNQENLYNGL